MATKIEWCDETWSPITGCSAISAGCLNCYAANLIKRFGKIWGYDFTPTFHPDRLGKPAEWKTPKKVFVCSMADLFHDKVTWSKRKTSYLWWSMGQYIMDVIANCQQHIFMILTKRPERMVKHLTPEWGKQYGLDYYDIPQNLWLGVTVEDADNLWRVEELLKLRPYASKLFVSVEPMLGVVDLLGYLEGCASTRSIMYDYAGMEARKMLDWVICGPENGSCKREFREEWALDLRDQCRAAGVPFFFKGGELGGKRYEQFPK